MIRGTTPTHIFGQLPVLAESIKEIWITYLSNGKTLITKTKESITLTNDEVASDDNPTCTATVTLTQNDTLAFTQGQASVQIRLLLVDGTAMASDEVPLTVKRIIRDGRIE